MPQWVTLPVIRDTPDSVDVASSQSADPVPSTSASGSLSLSELGAALFFFGSWLTTRWQGGSGWVAYAPLSNTINASDLPGPGLHPVGAAPDLAGPDRHLGGGRSRTTANTDSGGFARTCRLTSLVGYPTDPVIGGVRVCKVKFSRTPYVPMTQP